MKTLTEPILEGVSIKSRWEKLDRDRHPILARARECAKLTIPSLLPPEGATQITRLPTPYQGLGARGVNNLASKLLLALLPPNNPFFRMRIDDYIVEQMEEDGSRTEIEKALSTYERAIMTEIETQAMRVQAFEALKHLIVTGNGLLFLPDEGGLRFFRLDQYCVKRDPMGQPIEIVIKESIHPLTLPLEVREQIDVDLEKPEEVVDLYTMARLNDRGMWETAQEVEGIRIPGSEGTYRQETSPWIPLRWYAVDGEDYGRGYVEEYLGDLKTLEALTKSLVEFAAVAARIIFLINPNGTTRAKKLEKTPNGGFAEGSKDDVSVLQLEKFADFRVVQVVAAGIEQRLSHAFLLVDSVRRDAERVTAEEIRTMARELEDALGGVYTVLSQEFQLPLVRRIIHQMERSKRLPPLPEDIVKPSIVTGLEALGRGHDLERLTVFFNALQPLGHEVVAMYLNVSDYINRIGTSLGIDTDGLVRSPEEVAMMQQQVMMQQMAQQVVPGATQEFVKGMVREDVPQKAAG